MIKMNRRNANTTTASIVVTPFESFASLKGLFSALLPSYKSLSSLSSGGLGTTTVVDIGTDVVGDGVVGLGTGLGASGSAIVGASVGSRMHS